MTKVNVKCESQYIRRKFLKLVVSKANYEQFSNRLGKLYLMSLAIRIIWLMKNNSFQLPVTRPRKSLGRLIRHFQMTLGLLCPLMEILNSAS